MISTPTLRVGVAALGPQPHARLVGVLVLLERAELAAVRHGLHLDGTLLSHLGSRSTALDHRPEVLRGVGDRLLEVDLLGKAVGPLVELLELQVSLRDLVGIFRLDSPDGVDAVGERYCFVLKLLEIVHVL